MDAAAEREFTEFVAARSMALLRTAVVLTGDRHRPRISCRAPTATWVVAESGGERRVECALPAGWDGVPRLRLAGVETEGASLVTDDGLGAGSYADPVTRVTVQYGDGPEQEAVVWDGLWFDPLDHARLRGEGGSCEGPLPYVVRGYDEGGRAVTGASFDVEGNGVEAGPTLAAATCQP